MSASILVPIDGSDHAEKALRLAADMARNRGATLHVVHALIQGHLPRHIRALSDKAAEESLSEKASEGFTEAELPREGADVHVEAAQAPREVLEDIAARLLEKATETAGELGVTGLETAWYLGDPVEMILEQAQARGADTIVLGSRGLSDLQGVVLGSVSHKVGHEFDGTVVTVK